MLAPEIVEHRSGEFSVDAFREFVTRTSDYDVLTKWFDANVASENMVTSMLSVGYGMGFDLVLGTRLGPSLNHVTSLQPDLALQVNTTPAYIQLCNNHVCVNLEHVTFEQFVPKCQYDLILFSHALYYVPDRMATLSRALNMLTPRGFVLVFHQTEHGMYHLQKKFDGDRRLYCLNELRQDITRLNLMHKTSILDSKLRIDTLSRSLCDFILKKTSTDDEFTRLQAHLVNQGSLLYQPVAVVIIHQELKAANEANKDISIDKLRHDLLCDGDARLLTAVDLKKIGRFVFGHADIASLYGRSPDEIEAQGLHVFARTGIECVFDPYAIPIAKRIAAIIKERYAPNKRVVIVDPFLGSGNQLYHVMRATGSTAAFGIDNNAKVCQQTVHNFALLNVNIPCVCDEYINASRVLQQQKHKSNNGQLPLLVINVSPPWADGFSFLTGLHLDKTLPAINQIIPFYYDQFSADYDILFAICVPEKIHRQSLNDLFALSSFHEIYHVNVSSYGTNVNCIILAIKDEKIIDRRLTSRDYQSAYVDFISRFTLYDEMERSFMVCMKDGDSVRRMLSVGAGLTTFQTRIVKCLTNLDVFHCVEPNLHFIKTFREHTHSTNVRDKRLFSVRFNDFHGDGTNRYDVILFPYSLNYIMDQQLQIVKALQTLLDDGGSIIIFHQGDTSLSAQLQKDFGIQNVCYNIAKLKFDLTDAKLKYTMDQIDSQIDNTNLGEDFHNFLLARYTNEAEHQQMNTFFEKLHGVIPSTDTCIQIRKCDHLKKQTPSITIKRQE